MIELFNLMSYFSVSGVSSTGEESLNYLSQLTIDIDREGVNRNNGLLGITDKDQDDLLYWSEGTLIVDWIFNEHGYPDFEQTVFDFSNLFFTYDKKEFEEYYNSEYVQSILSLTENPYQKSNNFNVTSKKNHMLGNPTTIKSMYSSNKTKWQDQVLSIFLYRISHRKGRKIWS